MDLNLRNKVAIVTGAGRGIGAAVVKRLLDEGVRVLAVSRRPSAPLHSSASLRHISIDVTADDAPAVAVAAAIETFGQLDLFVNNAGGGARLTLAPFELLTRDDWDDALATNLLAAVRMTHAAASWLERTGGAIINVSSIGAHRVEGPPLAYNVAKAALTAFGRGVAPELAARGIRIATVSPGPTRTAMWDRFAEAAGVPVDAVVAKIPEQMGMLTGRLIDPAEIADAIVYLASPLSRSVVGAEFIVDGGALRGM